MHPTLTTNTRGTTTMPTHTLSPTIKVRTNKHPARRGISKAIAYRNNIFDPASDLEAMIEAYGDKTIRRVIDAIMRKRASMSDKFFEEIKV